MLNSACWGILHYRYCLPLEFFSNITSFSYFLNRQNPDFSPFSNSQFLRTGTRRTYVHPFDLDYWAKTRYRPIFRHCLGAVLQYLAIFYENLHWIPKIWAEYRENFNKIGDVSDQETQEQMLVMCAWVCAIVSWRPEYLMSSKTGNSANVFRC